MRKDTKRELRIEYKTPPLKRRSNSLDTLLSGQTTVCKDLWFTPRQLHRELLHCIIWETGKRILCTCKLYSVALIIRSAIRYQPKISYKIVNTMHWKFKQSCILNHLSVPTDICYPLSVIRISAKFYIGASLLPTHMQISIVYYCSDSTGSLCNTTFSLLSSWCWLLPTSHLQQ